VNALAPGRRRLRLAAFACCIAAPFAFAAARAQSPVAVPGLASPVTDLAGVLDAGQAAALDARLRAFEREQGSQVAVLVVPTTRPEEIEQYAIRVAEAWRLGRKGIDDGALLLVAVEDRRVRIEVGYGLEGALPDATTNRIIEEDIVPRFRAGDYPGGIDAGVDRMLRVIQGEPLPAPVARSPVQGVPALFQSLPILFLFAIAAGSILRRLLGRVGGALATGGLLGLLAWALVGVLAVALFVGVVGFILALLGGLGGGGGGNGWSSRRHGGGWGHPGGFGGGFGGGGGGWSGGGGGFGGGGASGRW
jgi:uncharacterized protein